MKTLKNLGSKKQWLALVGVFAAFALYLAILFFTTKKMIVPPEHRNQYIPHYNNEGILTNPTPQPNHQAFYIDFDRDPLYWKQVINFCSNKYCGSAIHYCAIFDECELTSKENPNAKIKYYL